MGVYSISNRELDLSTGVIECAHEPGLEGAYHIVAESEANYNTIMQAVGVAELAVFESTGAEMIYEAGDVKGFFGKMKEFFMNLWEKIKGLFKKFFAMFDSYTKNDKDFIAKYKKDITAATNLKGFKYKGYNFTLDAVDVQRSANKIQSLLPNSTPNNKSGLEEFIKKFEDRVELVEKMRGAAIGESSLEASEFAKELFKALRSGEDTKEEIDNISASEQLLAISENSALKKAAQNQYKVLEKEVKEAINTLEKSEKELLKDIPGKGDKEGAELRALQIKAANTHIANLRDKLNILQIVNGAKLSAIKDCNRQAKAICVALINYRPKNESTSVFESGFLAGVTLR